MSLFEGKQRDLLRRSQFSFCLFASPFFPLLIKVECNICTSVILLNISRPRRKEAERKTRFRVADGCLVTFPIFSIGWRENRRKLSAHEAMSARSWSLSITSGVYSPRNREKYGSVACYAVHIHLHKIVPSRRARRFARTLINGTAQFVSCVLARARSSSRIFVITAAYNNVQIYSRNIT